MTIVFGGVFMSKQDLLIEIEHNLKDVADRHIGSNGAEYFEVMNLRKELTTILPLLSEEELDNVKEFVTSSEFDDFEDVAQELYSSGLLDFIPHILVASDGTTMLHFSFSRYLYLSSSGFYVTTSQDDAGEMDALGTEFRDYYNVVKDNGTLETVCALVLAYMCKSSKGYPEFLQMLEVYPNILSEYITLIFPELAGVDIYEVLSYMEEAENVGGLIYYGTGKQAMVGLDRVSGCGFVAKRQNGWHYWKISFDKLGLEAADILVSGDVKVKWEQVVARLLNLYVYSVNIPITQLDIPVRSSENVKLLEDLGEYSGRVR